MSKNLILLTEIITVLTDEAQKKLEEAITNRIADDEGGLDAEAYDRLGIKPPKDSPSNELTFNDSEVESDYLDLLVDVNDISYVSQHEIEGSEVHLKNGDILRVNESIREIYHQVYSKRKAI